MPSAAQTAPISSTVSNIARCMAIACARPWCFSMISSEAGKKGEIQPPLRPEAPKPTMSFSSTATRRLGSALAR